MGRPGTTVPGEGDAARQMAATQPAPHGRAGGATQFVPLQQRHPAHAATWNQVGQVTYQAPPREHLTATACVGRTRANVHAVFDMGKKTRKKAEPKEPPGQTGSLDPPAGPVTKGQNVKLQLADSSGSGPAKELDPNDVPAWRTKMCVNRMAVLQQEKRKLREKERAVQAEIERKTAIRNRAAADLTWKKKEVGYVENTIADFRKELAHREKEVADHIEEERAAILAATRNVGVEKRTRQKAREQTIVGISTFDLSERQRTNRERERTSALTIADIYATIAVAKEENGEQMRKKRAENAETIADVEKKDLERLQKIAENVKAESALSAQRLREKIELTQKKRSEEYIANRTAQFNEFKKAAMVTQKMQAETAEIVEQLRGKFEATRALEKTLQKI